MEGRARKVGWRSPKLALARQAEHRLNAHRQFFRQYDKYLDRNSETNWLADARVAKVIRDNLYHHNGTKYELLAYCVMPSHVHLLLQPFHQVSVGYAASVPFFVGYAASVPENQGPPAELISDEQPDSTSPLTAIMHSLKSFTANKANEALWPPSSRKRAR